MFLRGVVRVVVDYVRDASLALLCGVVLIGGLVRFDSLSLLTDPTALVVGVAGALVVKAAFVAGTPAGRLWERRAVQAGAVGALLAGAALVAWMAGPWILAAVCWGLATYFVLLAMVVTGVWNPE